MSKLPEAVWELSETLTLCEYQSPKNGSFGFWLYDTTRGMNLSMRAKTSNDAFVEALTYYQDRLEAVESAHYILQTKLDAFVALAAQFSEPTED